MHDHEKFIRRCLDLAANGRGFVAPNPQVGCVIVAGNRIIGEGWHREFGKEHAEIKAFASVKPEDKHLLKEATLYVNLEPCSHFGKTPPCADRIIEEGIPDVVICNTDPNPLVAGQGIEKLKAAGINVTSGILETEGHQLNRRFFTFHQKKRPFITLKWAQTSDGFISRTGERTAISGETALRFTHQLRSEHMAILVGANTALVDNPSLSLRFADGRQPVRILIDPRLRVPLNNPIFSGDQKTLIFNLEKSSSEIKIEWIKVGSENLLTHLLEKLYNQNIQSVLVEGGSYTLQQFIHAGLWDEAYVYRSRSLLSDGIKAPVLDRLPVGMTALGTDQLYSYTA